MQVSVETTSALGRRMTIGLPADKVDGAVNQRLAETAKRVRIDGFRQGKVPVSVVRQRFGADVRNEVIGEMMRQSFVDALGQEKLQLAGAPTFEAVADNAGADVEFVATFEVYPEVALADISALSFENIKAEVSDSDINDMLDNLRKQRVTYQAVERAAQDGDRVEVDFVGKLEGEVFDGGSAKGQNIVLGSGSMIPGFETGIVGMNIGETKTIDVTFPEGYRAEHLAGKAAQFDITLNKVNAAVLPELNAEFFASFGTEDSSEEGFRKEVRQNMQREAKSALRNKLKRAIVEALAKAHTFELPAALINEEVQRMQMQFAREMQQQGQKVDASALPAELFKAQADQRVRTGLVFSELSDKYEITATEAAVQAYLEEVASVYQDPKSVIDYYYNNQEQLNQVKAVVLEEAIIDKVLELAQVSEKTVGYAEAIRPAGQAE